MHGSDYFWSRIATSYAYHLSCYIFAKLIYISQMSITETDFQNCQLFFAKTLPEIIKVGSDNLSGFRTCDTAPQRIETLCLILDIVGSECIKEATMAETIPQWTTSVNLEN